MKRKILKKSFIKMGNFFAGIFLLFSVIPCFAEKKSAVPYCFEEFKVVSGEKLNLEDSFAAIFALENTGIKKIQKFSLVFTVTDFEGKNPFTGGNSLVVECAASILPGEIFRMYMPLDEYLSDSETSDLILEEVFLKRIEYDDGSLWEDKFGFYSVSQEIPFN